MSLNDFAKDAEIFIDANIFTCFALQNPTYQAACTSFLGRVEAGDVQSVTSYGTRYQRHTGCARHGRLLLR
ncbi:MAG: hypothetical protein Kow0063_45020 [Anaerolineae bacterium]